jgi:dolichol-phosphate mannosyltransferase
MKLFVVVPTYNEAANLPKLASTLFELPLRDINLLIVDDCSPDGTGEIAEHLKEEFPGHVHVLHRKGKLGLGTAYKEGFKFALSQGADAIAQMDADFSHPPNKLVDMVNILDSCDVVLGSRYIDGGELDQNWPIWRKGLSRFGNFYARTILGLSVLDTTGGFRLWKGKVLEGMPMDRILSNGYAFQIEMTYVASLQGHKFVEVPIYFADRQWGDSKMSLSIQVEAAIRVWKLLWSYRDLK